jgi:hypothetical protein
MSTFEWCIMRPRGVDLGELLANLFSSSHPFQRVPVDELGRFIASILQAVLDSAAFFGSQCPGMSSDVVDFLAART